MSPSDVPIPALFLERMSRLLGEEYPAFAAALTEEPRHGLRVNTLKLRVEEFRRISPFPLGEKVPWCEAAYSLTPFPSRSTPEGLPQEEGLGVREPGKHPYHQAGLYYLQDPSAMSAAELLAPRPGERLLDLAAAPGGKTTHLAALMEAGGLLVANEIKTSRLNHLIANLERWGAGNAVVTNETPERLADHFGAFFDRVLVDAPCSGEGMFRKDPGARLDWSEQMVAGCAVRQTNILRVAAHLVRPGGSLLYSTCTFAPEEDEAVIDRFLREHAQFEVVALPQLPGFMPGRPEWLKFTAENAEIFNKFSAISVGSAVKESLRGSVRLFPHRLAGDGHFVCLLQRGGGDAADLTSPWKPVKIPAVQMNTWHTFRQENLKVDFPEARLRLQGDRLYLTPEGVPDMKGLRATVPGVWLGNFKKERFEPAHPLALFLRKEQAQKVLSLPAGSRELAGYLRGESIRSEGTPGWVLVCVDNFPLGWGKRVQGVVKNHYPRGWQVYS